MIYHPIWSPVKGGGELMVKPAKKLNSKEEELKMRKALILGLALVFVMGMTAMVGANNHLDGPWYVDTSEYTGLGLEVNAEILQLGNDDLAEINQQGNHQAFIGQGYEFTLGAYGDSFQSEAFIDQMGHDNEAVIGQRGEMNFADIDQSGIENYAGVGQDGDLMTADINQHAYDSFVRASQFGGEDSEVIVNQFGHLNRVRTRQEGDNHFAEVYQAEESDWNYANIEQAGNDQDAFINQAGMHNGAYINQQGAWNRAGVDQDGDYNEATINQDAYGLSGLITQEGNSNVGTINQTGGGE